MTNTVQQATIQVVFIEDYQLVRVGIASYLDRIEDIKVVGQAETAEEGLKQIEQYKPQVVLMDLGLPGMNGIEATKIIKRNYPDVRVIVLTSHENEESVISALGAGAHAYCLKDISSERLVEVIRVVNDGGAWLDPTIARVALSVFTQGGVKKPLDANQDFSLGDRELQVLTMLTQGMNNNEIAEKLFISVHTVKSQVSTILQKLAVNDRVQAAVKAVTTGLVSLEE
ncbi:MAG: response regulator [Candidatus Melainabacteria bacterium]